MASDSSNKLPDQSGKVVSLGRHEFVAQIEQKLAEARRLFSLHEYTRCEELVHHVLDLDPQNSKARALMDLNTLKLSKRKLYKKMVTPVLEPGEEARRPPSPSSSGTPASGPSLPSKPTGSGSPATPSANLSRRGGQDDKAAREALDSSERSLPKDTLREKTISALVELFQRKEMGLQDWSDPRFKSSKLAPEETSQAKPSRSASSEAPASASPSGMGARGEAARRGTDVKLGVGQTTEAKPNRAVTPPKPDYQELVAKKFEERSEDLRRSEIKTVSIAQIKKYLYQEEYDLCSQELEKIRGIFLQNAEIQAFVDNTSRRLAQLQHIKQLEAQAKELMASATAYYQEGKLPEALVAANEVIRMLPNHQQAKEFVEFVEKRLEKERKKLGGGEKARYCWSCGVAVDLTSRFCFHCGQRLS